jgi:hypothetical protein
MKTNRLFVVTMPLWLIPGVYVLGVVIAFVSDLIVQQVI